MVNTNSVLSSILFSQTIDWNIKQFFSSTSINSSFELKRIGKAITRRKDQMVVEDDKRYKRITIKTNCGGVFVRDEVLGIKSLYFISSHLCLRVVFGHNILRFHRRFYIDHVQSGSSVDCQVSSNP